MKLTEKQKEFETYLEHLINIPKDAICPAWFKMLNKAEEMGLEVGVINIYSFDLEDLLRWEGKKK